MSALVYRTFWNRRSGRNTSELLALVSHPLEICTGLDYRQHELKVRGGGGAYRKNTYTLFVQNNFHTIDNSITQNESLCKLSVALYKGRNRAIELLLYQGALCENATPKLLAALVQAPRDMTGKARACDSTKQQQTDQSPDGYGSKSTG